MTVLGSPVNNVLQLFFLKGDISANYKPTHIKIVRGMVCLNGMNFFTYVT